VNILIYEYEKMQRAGQLLNLLVVSGTSNFRALSELADILDSGKPGSIEGNKEEGENKDGMEREKI